MANPTDEQKLEALRRRRRVILVLTFVLIFVLLGWIFRAVLTPFLVAVFIAYMLDPVVEKMEAWSIAGRIRLGRGGAIIVLYLMLLSTFYIAGLYGIPALNRQMSKLRKDLPVLGEWVEYQGQRIEEGLKAWQENQQDEADPAADETGEEDPSGKADEPENADETENPDEPTEETPDDPDSDEIDPTAPVPEERVPPDLNGRVRLTFHDGSHIEAEVVSRTEDQVAVLLGRRFYVFERSEIAKEEQLEAGEGIFAIRRLVQRGIRSATVHIDSILGFAFRFVKGFVTALYKLVLILMITAFLVIDRPQIVRFMQNLPPPHKREEYSRLRHYLDRGLAGVIRGQLAIMAVNGVLTWLGLQLLGVSYSILLGLIAGLFSLIPIFGTILSTIPIVMIAWGAGGSVQQGILALCWILMIHFLEANFLNPKIMGTASKIHPVLVIFALIAGEHAYGLVGALLAVPTASLIQSWFKFYVIDRVPEEIAEDTDVALA